jgi:hypothetical protein
MSIISVESPWCHLQQEVKWLKRIYLIDRTIKGFESQGKSGFQNRFKVDDYHLMKSKTNPKYFCPYL